MLKAHCEELRYRKGQVIMDFATERLKKQVEFLIEIDKIKHIFRKTKLFNKSRFENESEHAWHLAVMALLISEYSN